MTRLLDQRPEKISICLELRSPCPHCGPSSHCEEKFLPNAYSHIFTFFDIPFLLLVGLSTFAYLNILEFQRVGNFRCKNPTWGITYLFLTSRMYSLPWIACSIAWSTNYFSIQFYSLYLTYLFTGAFRILLVSIIDVEFLTSFPFQISNEKLWIWFWYFKAVARGLKK